MKKLIVFTLFRGQTCQSYDLPFEGASCPRQCVAREKAFFAIYWAFFSAFRDQPMLIFQRREREPGAAWQRLAQKAFEELLFPGELHRCTHLTNSAHSLLHRQTCDLGLSHHQVDLSCLEKSRRAIPALRGCYWQPVLPYVCAVSCLSGRNISC